MVKRVFSLLLAILTTVVLSPMCTAGAAGEELNENSWLHYYTLHVGNKYLGPDYDNSPPYNDILNDGTARFAIEDGRPTLFLNDTHIDHGSIKFVADSRYTAPSGWPSTLHIQVSGQCIVKNYGIVMQVGSKATNQNPVSVEITGGGSLVLDDYSGTVGALAVLNSCNKLVISGNDTAVKLICKAEGLVNDFPALRWQKDEYTSFILQDNMEIVSPSNETWIQKSDTSGSCYTISDATSKNNVARTVVIENAEKMAAHKHSWSDEWTTDGTSHWHECADIMCPVTDNSLKGGYAEHTIKKESDENKHWSVCEICGWTSNKASHIYNTANWRFDETHHWKFCSYCNRKVLFNPHNTGDKWTINASSHYKRCFCGKSVDYGPHVYSDKWIITDTTHCRKCDICGGGGFGAAHTKIYEYDDIQHWQKCSVCTWTEAAKAPHVFTDDNDTTCDCGYTRSLDQPEHQHAWNLRWSSDADNHWHDCTAAGCDITDNSKKDGYAAHTWSATWKNDDTHHWKKCNTCDYEDIDNKSVHVYTDNTDTDCNTCGYTRTINTPEHEHTWSTDWDNNLTHHWHNCTADRCDVTNNSQKDGYAVHTWDLGKMTTEPTENAEGINTFECTVCKKTRTEPIPKLEHRHDWSDDWESDADNHWKSCKTCHEKNTESIAAHTWDSGKITTAPTVDSPGVRTYTCTVCSATKTEQVAALPAYSVSGKVVDKDGAVVEEADVMLMQGWVTRYSAKTNAQGEYSFGKVEPDIYNLVAKKDDITKTTLVTVKDSDVGVETLKMPAGKTNSVLEVKESSDAPKVVVGGLAVEAEKYSEADTTVEVKLNVEKVDTPKDVTEEKFKEAMPEKTEVEMYLDFSLFKSITPDGEDKNEQKLNKTESGALEIVIPYEFEEGYDVMVFRAHGGEVERFKKLDGAPGNVKKDGTFYPDREGGFIRVYSEKFSTIALTKIDSNAVPDTSDTASKPSYGGGSGYYPTYYKVTVPDTLSGGTASASHKQATAGTTVTVAVKPDDGFKLSEVSAVTQSGTKVELTEKEDGIYTFSMPASNVEVSADFVKIGGDIDPPDEGCKRDETCPIWPFTDASTTAWYHDGVHYCLDHGLMIGYGNNIFKPSTDTSRAMLTTMLWRLSGSPKAQKPIAFTDVDQGRWYTEAIRWASEQGIVVGYGDGRFGPEDPLTREQMVVILWRYAQHEGVNVSVSDGMLTGFIDADTTSGYAISAVSWACDTGILVGISTPDGMTLDPKGHGSRAQVAAVVMRYVQQILK